jgi:hypothetical protein
MTGTTLNAETTVAIKQEWVQRGFFNFGAAQGRASPSQQIRAALAAGIGVSEKALGIASYPVGPAFRHTFWWREGTRNYSEAQFYMQIAKEYPVISVGVSVEKGYEDPDSSPSDSMDRGTWDWSRMVSNVPDILGHDVPAISQALQRPVQLRIRPHRRGATHRHEAATFSFADGQWFRRHEGSASASSIGLMIQELDGRRDTWVDLYIAADYADTDAAEFTPTSIGQIFLQFAPLRARLRGQRLSV